ncbi:MULTISPECIES: enoyl-CoA hydratase-related protein [unclassified Mycobacterium]|uniref:enoyl-CoA hydratase-related protein n=1 Tax=unclassified Mycobacterium TaxID=2642494 RepID=UPI001E30A5D1|nr:MULTISPECIES: enoyl-CoA hydratase-related protein [unclassified Mycobacterium]
MVEPRDAALRITLNRPDVLNSVDAAMFTTITTALVDAARDSDVRVVVVTGAGRAFCSGADIGAGSDPGGGEDILNAANRTILAIRALEKPVLAAVNGLAAGVGVSLAAACDLAIAAPNAYFLLAFSNIGLMPDGGATALIPAAIGRSRALRMALLAERVSAADAAQWGLISHIAEGERFGENVDALVARLAAGPPLAYAETKRAINAATVDHLAAAIDRESMGQDRLVRSSDFREGISAFQSKRRPSFGGA